MRLFWPSVILIVLAGLATLYHVGVPWQTPWRRDLPGALLADGVVAVGVGGVCGPT